MRNPLQLGYAHAFQRAWALEHERAASIPGMECEHARFGALEPRGPPHHPLADDGSLVSVETPAHLHSTVICAYNRGVLYT